MEDEAVSRRNTRCRILVCYVQTFVVPSNGRKHHNITRPKVVIAAMAINNERRNCTTGEGVPALTTPTTSWRRYTLSQLMLQDAF